MAWRKHKYPFSSASRAPGVYVIYDQNDSLIYIGQSKCLYCRISGHPHFGRGCSVKVKVIKSRYARRLLEGRLIDRLRPERNRSIPDWRGLFARRTHELEMDQWRR